MPTMPTSLCKHAGCNAKAIASSLCKLHQSIVNPTAKPVIKQAEPALLKRIENRPSSTQRGYDARWRSARLLFLEDHPLCVDCLANGITKGADVVDHIIPHRGDNELFWCLDNWQPLCYPCHSIKTTTIDNKLNPHDIFKLKRKLIQDGVGKK